MEEEKQRNYHLSRHITFFYRKPETAITILKFVQTYLAYVRGPVFKGVESDIKSVVAGDSQPFHKEI